MVRSLNRYTHPTNDLSGTQATLLVAETEASMTTWKGEAHRPLIVGLTLLFLAPALALAQNGYVKVTADTAEIRVGAASGSDLVGHAIQGDIFNLEGESGAWYEIDVTSGEYRYLPQAAAIVVKDEPSVPSSVSRRKEIIMEMTRAEDRATCEALERYPDRIERQIDYERLLQDRYQLRVAQKYRFPVARWDSLMTEGARKAVEGEWELPNIAGC